jgi:ABC-type transport system involved in cytochrome bd biosynthesis fused ATPase/permease subunit
LNAIRFHVSKINELLNSLKLDKKLVAGILSLYYFVTVANAFLEGVGMILIVNIFAGDVEATSQNELLAYITSFVESQGVDIQFPGIVPFLVGLFGVNLVTRFSLLACDGAFIAILRRKIQERIFEGYILGDWSHMRNFRVGDAVGTNTQEAMLIAKYLTSSIAAIYFILSALIVSAMAMAASLKVSFMFLITALPLMLLTKKVFGAQAKLSKRSAEQRNRFSSDITDQFNGLLQIHVDGNYEFHLQQGLRAQIPLFRLEILVGICQSVIGTFGLLLPFLALTGLSVWLNIMGSDHLPNIALMASVGILGLRVISQLTNAVASLGNLSRLSGGIYPVLNALSVPAAPIRQPIEEQIVRIQIDKVSYAYYGNTVIDGVTCVVEKGVPLLLSGRSGKGKTTLANLISGLYFPDKGEVLYIGESGKEYASTSYRAKIGFVTQDIYLFQGSLRVNLVAGRECTEEQIWATLEQVDAVDFVRSMGGLDVETAEAGRSLSGGERRRLGLARVLLSGSNILIFDEVTAGLDQANKAAVLNVIERLSETYIVVMISHEKLSLSRSTSFAV